MAKKKSTSRRSQAEKDSLNSRARAQVDRSRSNAAGPHPRGDRYDRKVKHVSRQEW